MTIGRTVREKRLVRLEITVYRQRLQDPDNKVGSCKHLIDALVDHGWLYDDSPEYMDLDVREVKSKRKEIKTVVRLK